MSKFHIRKYTFPKYVSIMHDFIYNLQSMLIHLMNPNYVFMWCRNSV
jgi:hypothetical protein